MNHLRGAASIVAILLLLGSSGTALAWADDVVPTPAANSSEPVSATLTPTATAGPSATESPSQTAFETPQPTPSASDTALASPSSEPLSQAAVTPAAVGEAYHLATDSLCPGSLDAAATNTSGAVTIDLDTVGIYTWLVVDSDAAASCKASITSFSIIGTGTNVVDIEIGNDAFAQTSGIANTLTSVSFPDGVAQLNIGKRAFAQYSTVGPNTLELVRFPSSGLDRISISDDAFRQETTATGSGNALASVILSAASVTCATGAFAQFSDSGDNALASVTLAGVEDDSLLLLSGAFQQQAGGDNALTSIALPAGMTQFQFTTSVFAQEAGGDNALASLTVPPTLAELDVLESAFSQKAGGHNALTSLSFPKTMTWLNVDTSAFAQETTGTADTSLTSVQFPTTVAMLIVGPAGFAQTSAGGDTSLRTVTFPTETAYGVGFDTESFSQTAPNGHTALTAVTLPANTPSVYIAERAFAQTSTSNTLTRVVFPATLSQLWVGYRAFAQASDSVLSELVFPFASPPSQGALIESSAVPTDADWVWFGADATKLSDWPALKVKSVAATRLTTTPSPSLVTPRSDTATPVLSGYRTLSLKNLDSPQIRYVYRDGQTVSTPLSGQTTTIGPANAHGGWTTTLPSATSSLGSFAGWCTTAVTGTKSCTGNTQAGGSEFTVSSDTELWASWRTAALLPPTIPAQTLSTGVVGKAFRQVITVHGDGTITCAISAGRLPAGLSLQGCTISGTPTKAGGYSVTVTASNSAGSTQRQFRLTIAAEQLAYTGTDGALPLLSVAAALILGGVVLRHRSASPRRGSA